MNLLKIPWTLRPRTVYKILTVNYNTSQHPTRYLEVQDHWRDKDNVSKRYQLVYKAPMEQLLNYATGYLTISTGIIGVFGAYYLCFVFDEDIMKTPVIIGEDIVIASSGTECLTYLVAFFAFHAAVKILLSKYVLRLYQDGDNYIAVFRGHMFNSIKTHEFKLKDVKKLNPLFAVAWSDARFNLGTKKAILLSDYFKTPEYYNKLVYKNEDEIDKDSEQ